MVTYRTPSLYILVTLRGHERVLGYTVGKKHNPATAANRNKARNLQSYHQAVTKYPKLRSIFPLAAKGVLKSWRMILPQIQITPRQVCACTDLIGIYLEKIISLRTKKEFIVNV